MTRDRCVELLGDDWKDDYSVERCEFEGLMAVHFVIKGLLQEGVSSSSVLDGFGKSVGEFLRARYVDVPVGLVEAEDRETSDTTFERFSHSNAKTWKCQGIPTNPYLRHPNFPN